MTLSSISTRYKHTDWVVCATVLVLGIPYVIYSMSWLRWYVAVPFTGILIASLALSMKAEEKGREAATTPNFPFGWQSLFVTIALLMAWNYFSGVGHFASQNGDWIKHDAVMMDLSNRRWPVVYTVGANGRSFPLVYYLAYYLPIGLAGKLFQVKFAVTYFAYAWNLLAMFLAVTWVFRFIGGFSLLALVGFIFFSGLDIVPFLMQHDIPPLTYHLEGWMGKGVMQFSSNSTVLYWAPQHGIGTWLGTSLLLHQYLNKNTSNNTLLYWALSLFWSPFVFIGQLFLVVVDLAYKKFNGFFSFHNTVGFISIIAIFGLFFSSRVSSNTPEFIGINQLLINWYPLLLFITVECFVYFPFILWAFDSSVNKKYRYLCIIIIANIVPAMLIRLGMFNDFCMRVSLPSLFILQVLLFKNFVPFSKQPKRIAANLLLLGVLALGAQTSIREIYRGIDAPRKPINYQITVDDLGEAALLYIGSSKNFYNKYLAASQ